MLRFIQKIMGFVIVLLLFYIDIHGMVAGGRPNSISGGQNAFAGVVNPANAVWIPDRFDAGLFVIHQDLAFNNHNNNPRFNPGNNNLTYHAHSIVTGDAAIHKRTKINGYECSFSLAAYTVPGYLKLRTKHPIPALGTTPLYIKDRTQAVSGIFSLKLQKNLSVGFSLDYFYLSHLRNGFQNANNPLRSVSPGNVTNNGMDHSEGVGLSLGLRWNITQSLAFGLAYIKKSHVGQFRRYRGYEPHHGKNYIPQSFGGGFTYRITPQVAGRLEVVWINYGNLPNSNNGVLPDGKVNTHKRGSNKSPGGGLQDATFINLGLGYKVNKMLSLGAGFSHRVELLRKSPYIVSRAYTRQVVYDLITFGVNFNYCKNDFFLTLSHGFENFQVGTLPREFDGGRFTSTKNYNALSLAWGYLY